MPIGQSDRSNSLIEVFFVLFLILDDSGLWQVYKNKKQKTNKKKIKAILYFKFMNIFLTMTQTWGIVFIWYVQSTWIILL